MPISCSVTQCGSRKNKNQAHLTFHRFPKNEIKRKQWISIIGVANINPRHKDPYVCSLHFEDSCFNRTLDIVRLRDNAVPSAYLFNKEKIPVLAETLLQSTNKNLEIVSTEATFPTGSQYCDQLQPSTSKLQHTDTIRKLSKTCNEQRIKIKRLNEKVRIRNKKIAVLKDIIECLKKRNQINNEQSHQS